MANTYKELVRQTRGHKVPQAKPNESKRQLRKRKKQWAKRRRKQLLKRSLRDAKKELKKVLESDYCEPREVHAPHKALKKKIRWTKRQIAEEVQPPVTARIDTPSSLIVVAPQAISGQQGRLRCWTLDKRLMTTTDVPGVWVDEGRLFKESGEEHKFGRGEFPFSSLYTAMPRVETFSIEKEMRITRVLKTNHSRKFFLEEIDALHSFTIHEGTLNMLYSVGGETMNVSLKATPCMRGRYGSASQTSYHIHGGPHESFIVVVDPTDQKIVAHTKQGDYVELTFLQVEY